MPSHIAVHAHLMIGSPVDVDISRHEETGQFSVAFRVINDDPLSVVYISGQPSDLKAVLSKAIDLVDQAMGSS